MTLGLNPAEAILPALLMPRKIGPDVTFAFPIQVDNADSTHNGTGTVLT
jgi:hypothetical protein